MTPQLRRKNLVLLVLLLALIVIFYMITILKMTPLSHGG